MVIGSNWYKNKNEIRRNVHKLAFSPDFVSKYKVETSENCSCEMLINDQHHMEVLLSSFRLNGHTLGFHAQTQ